MTETCLPRIAIIGDRGIPARYSGFSTLVEQLATRLVADYEFQVTVYCRTNYYDEFPSKFKDVDCTYLRAPGGKNWESIVHSNLSILHAALRDFDLVFVVDPGNGPFLLPLVLRGVPRVVHTDGMGWKRQKWSPLQQKYYKWAEWVSARLATWLVTDSRVMQDYYQTEYQAPSSFIPYGGEIGAGEVDPTILIDLGLEPGQYCLVVARIEPENNVHLIIDEYNKTSTGKPLVVVGEARYGSAYSRLIADSTADRVKCIGAVWDPKKLNALFQNCYLYLHGHSVGGTNPSLLNAMHMGACSIPIDLKFHREVVGLGGVFFQDGPGKLAKLIGELDQAPERVVQIGHYCKQKSNVDYRWDAVVAGYAEVFTSLIKTKSTKVVQTMREQVYRPERFKSGNQK